MNLGNENEYQEFKEGLSQLDKGLKSLTSMLNKHGHATVYFGVDDNGDVCGLTIGKNTLMDIRNRIHDKIEPRIYADILEQTDDSGKQYIKVSAMGSNIPYSFDGRFYLRNVSADEKASNEVLRKMLSNSDSDILRQQSSPIQDLSFKDFFAILSGNGIHPNATIEFYTNYNLLNDDGKFNMNAYLLSDNNNISLKIVTFEGNDKSVMANRTEYGKKCILVSISEIMNYFETINVTNVDLYGAKRKEQSLFDFPSFREAWINACLHNDWISGVSPSIYLFDNRIEIVSYGGLPFSLTKEGFFKGTSVPVNKSLLMIFMVSKYAEQSGHGVPTIVKKYGEEAFSFDDGQLKVTIPLAFERAEVTARKEKIMIKNGLTANQQKVYNALLEDGNQSLQEVADEVGLTVGGVKKICLKLQEYGIIERNGSKRNGRWITK